MQSTGQNKFLYSNSFDYQPNIDILNSVGNDPIPINFMNEQLMQTCEFNQSSNIDFSPEKTKRIS